MQTPSTTGVERNVEHTHVVGWQLKITAMNRTNTLTTESTDEVAQLQYDVLTGSRSQGFRTLASDVVRSQQDYRKPNVSVAFQLLDHRAALIRLFVKNDRSQVKLANEPRYGLTDCFIVTVN